MEALQKIMAAGYKVQCSHLNGSVKLIVWESPLIRQDQVTSFSGDILEVVVAEALEKLGL